jgi:hypothetical protein
VRYRDGNGGQAFDFNFTASDLATSSVAGETITITNVSVGSLLGLNGNSQTPQHTLINGELNIFNAKCGRYIYNYTVTGSQSPSASNSITIDISGNITIEGNCNLGGGGDPIPGQFEEE